MTDIIHKRRWASRSARIALRAWLIFITACLVGGSLAYWRMHRRMPLITDQPADAVDNFRLVVLAYDVAATPEVDDDQIELPGWDQIGRHLDALREAGFRPVTLAQVEQAYYRGGKLPARSVLVTFDHGLLSTFQGVDPVLRRQQWPAVMFIDTVHLLGQDHAFLYWDRLQRMVDSGIWEIGTHGHGMSRRAGVLHDDPGFWRRLLRMVRLAEDDPVLRSCKVIEKRLRNCRVLAFAPRAQRHLAFARADIERQPGASACRLGFWTDAFGVNGSQSDPHRLMRLRITPTWPPQRLVSRLAWAVAAPSSDRPATADQSADRWILRSGAAVYSSNAILLKAQPRSDVWFCGSQWSRNWKVTARLEPDADEFWLVQEQEAASYTSWRWGGNRSGLFMQTMQQGAPSTLLWRQPFDGAQPRPHTVTVVKRGSGVWAEWDGMPFAPRPVFLPGQWQGKVGFVAACGSGKGTVRLENLGFQEIPYRVEPISDSPGALEIQRLAGVAQEVAAVSPPWLVQRAEIFEEQSFNVELVSILARRYAWDILPTIVPSGAVPSDEAAWRDTLLKQAAARRWAGLAVDLRHAPVRIRPAWEKAAAGWQRPFAERGLQLALLREEAGGAP